MTPDDEVRPDTIAPQDICPQDSADSTGSEPTGRHRPLTATERAILNFERTWTRHRGKKPELVREKFDMAMPTYYQHRRKALNNPEARTYVPLLVTQLTANGSEHKPADRTDPNVW